MMNFFHSIGLACLVVVAGCGGGSDLDTASALHLVAQPDSVTPGRRISVELSNESDRVIEHNAGYQVVSSPGGRPIDCVDPPLFTLDLRALAPGESRDFDVFLPACMQPGDYVVQKRVTIGGEPFVLEAPLEVRPIGSE